MTEMQKKMQELISQEELDRAFDARFPKEMPVSYTHLTLPTIA